LADISKINAVALANIAKLDAVLAANIAKVNGLVFTTAAGEFLLDNYTGAAAGYSVRRLATSATVLLRVRRDTAGGTGDDDEADVAYDSNNILSLDSAISNASVGVTATTLGQFLNVGTVNGTTYTNPDSLTVTASCFVDTWYDQAGSNDAEQATESAQPQIHDGTVNTDLITENGKPALNCDGVAVGLDATFTHTVTAQSNFAVAEFVDGISSRLLSQTVTGQSLNYDYEGTNHYIPMIRQQGNVIASYASGYKATKPAANNTQQLFASIHSGSSIINYVNASASSSASATLNTEFYVLRLKLGGNNEGMDGTLQEVISWSSDQDAAGNRSGIEENINSDYLIYQPTDAPTSGLLADYTGAAAAYSVRQLANTAAICMTVRRDSDDEEKRFGFDSNGDLDTTGIADFCTTANGYVSQWWDQSTNGNHASQGTAGSQPQIYNGTAVITENGKPAVQFDGVNDQFVHNISGIVSGDFTYADVMSSSDSAAILHSSTSVIAKWVMLAQISTQTILSDGFLTAYDGYFKNGTAALSSGATRTDFTNAFFDGNQNLAFYHGTTNSVATTQMYLGRYQQSGFYFVGKIQESILWTADESSNRTGIQSDINTYFSIY